MGKQAALELLRELATLGVRLEAVDGALKLDAPKGVLNAQRVARLKAYKTHLLELLSGSETSRGVMLQARQSTPLAPPSYAQQRFWLLAQLEPGNPQYHVPLALRLQGQLDVAALSASYRSLLQRHSVLRSVYEQNDNELRVRELPLPTTLPWQYEDVSQEGEPITVAQRLAQDLMAQPFDLARELPVRAVLVKVAERDHHLYLCLHHIAVDGWSLQLMVREFALLYRRYCDHHQGQNSCVRDDGTGDTNTAKLTEISLSYGDYAYWQQQRFAAGEWQHQLEYWQRQLADLPPLHELPLDFPRTAATPNTSRAGIVRVTLDAATLAAFKQLGRSHGVTLFMSLQALLAVVLHAYSGASDVVVGTPVAGRQDPRLEAVVGCFVNTLVLRSHVRGSLPFSTLLRQVRATVLAAFENQDVPFEHLVEVLNPPRQLGINPLFQICLALENQDPAAGSVHLPGLQLSALGQTALAAKFDLDIAASEMDGELRLGWEFNTACFTAASVQRMADCFVALARAVVSDDDRNISELLDSVGRAYWSAQGADHALIQPQPGDSGPYLALPQRFSRHAAQTPHAVALIQEQDGQVQRWTFAEVEAESDRLARFLKQRYQAGPGRRVALLMTRDVQQVLAILAVWKSGAAYVPLDPAHPDERLAAMMSDLAPQVVIYAAGEQPLALGLPQLSMRQWRRAAAQLAEDAAATTAPSLPVPKLVAASASDLAYLIYTSGSSGMPKAVMVSHGNLDYFRAAYLATLREQGVAADAVHGWNAAYTFDVSLQALSALCDGATLAVIPEAARVDGQALRRFVQAHDVAVMDITPSQLTPLLDDSKGALVPTLVVAGEAISHELWQRLAALQQRDDCCVIAGYGPTEATVLVATVRIQADQLPQLGSPLPGLCFYVVDTCGARLPPGAVGELIVGGAAVAQGYWRRPDLTARRFVADAYGPQRGARLYRTGDRVRLRSDGSLEYLGRGDQQLKLRGYRIEAGDIEAAIRGLPGVKHAAVALKAVGAEPMLVGYYVGEHTQCPHLLTDELRNKLPAYMVPAVLMPLARLPLNSSGKLDRKALPLPPATSALPEQPPQGLYEAELCQIYSELLGRGAVSVDADFFTLGGHSLLAVRLVNAVRQRLGIHVTMRDVFEHHTPRTLAAAMARRDQHSGLPPLLAQSSVQAPLSHAQRRFWMLESLHPGDPRYHVPVAVTWRGELSQDGFKVAFKALLQRHDILRTVYELEPVGGNQMQPMARVLADLDVPLTFMDGQGRDSQWLQQQARQFVLQPFDLSCDAPLRCLVVAVDRDCWQVHWCAHHIAVDAASLTILLHEFMAYYQAAHYGVERDAATRGLPPLTLRYSDYAHWQQHCEQDGVLQQQLAYWQRQLARLPALHSLPLDGARGTKGWARTQQTALDSAALKAFKQQCHDHGCTLFMGLQALFACVLAVYSGEPDTVMGTVIGQRDDDRLAPVVGCFINSLVLRQTVDTAQDFAQVLQQSRRMILDAFSHQHVPFEQLVEALQPPRQTHANPLFQILFTLQPPGNQRPLPHPPGATIELMATPAQASKVDLHLDASEHDDGLHLHWSYHDGLFHADTVARMAQCFLRLLRAVCDRPDCAVNTLVAVDAAALPVLSGEPLPAAAPLICQFLAAAERHPQRLALVCEGDSGEVRFTFAELAAAVQGWAGYLQRSKGLRPGQRVALILPRGAEQIIAILAVWHCGAAYVPLDPRHPEARLQAVLDDADVAVTITNAEVVQCLSETVVPGFALDVHQVASAAANHAPAQDTRPLAQPDSLAYVMYTSGSTGVPKGVMVSQHNLSAFQSGLLSRLRAAGVADDAVRGWNAAYTFDVSLEGIAALCAGAPLAVVPEAARGDAVLLRNFVQHHDVTVLDITPTHLHALLGADDLPLAPVVVVAGEAISRDFAARLGGLAEQGMRCFNAYGPTEATVLATMGAITAASDNSIGTPLPGVSTYVVDGQGQLLPPGAAGELLLCGDTVTHGYWRRPRQTAAAFVPAATVAAATSAGAAVPSSRLYCTGDRVRWRVDGTLEFLGRRDGQVKLHGYRIELGEVDNALLALPGVAHAAAAIKDRAGQPYLLGYVVLADDVDDNDQLRSDWHGSLQARLPHYMVPVRIVTLEHLPVNTSGKLDRAALPLPTFSDETAVGNEQAPQGPVEQALAEIWQRVLSLPHVGRHQAFYSLGGDSMRSIQLVQAAARAGLAFSLTQLLEAQTIAALAPMVEEAVSDKPDMRADEVVDELLAFPATATQQLMLRRYADDRERLPGQDCRGIFHVQQAFQFYARNVTHELLQQAMLQATDSDNFRTRFEWREGAWYQVVSTAPAMTFECLDWSARDQSAQEMLQALMLRDRQQAFVPEQVLARCYIAWCGHAEATAVLDDPAAVRNACWIVLFSHHHAIQDGWSQSVLLRRFTQAIKALLSAETGCAPQQLGDTRRYAEQEAAIKIDDRHAAYWRQECDAYQQKGGGFQSWPGDNLYAVPQFHGAALDESGCETQHGTPGSRHHASKPDGTHETGPGWAQRLDEQCRAHGFSPRAVWFHAWRQALRQIIPGLLNQDIRDAAEDIAVGVVCNGRNPDMAAPDESMGLFWNLVPVLRPLPQATGLLRVTRACQQHLEQAQVYGRFPVDAIQAMVPERSLFPATFNFVRMPVQAALRQVPGQMSGWCSLAQRDDFGYPLQCWISAGTERPHYWVQVAVAGTQAAQDRQHAQQLVNAMHAFVRHWTVEAERTPLAHCAGQDFTAGI